MTDITKLLAETDKLFADKLFADSAEPASIEPPLFNTSAKAAEDYITNAIARVNRGFDNDVAAARDWFHKRFKNHKIEIDYHIEQERKRKQKALKPLVRQRVPLQNRAQILTNMGL